MSCLSWLPQHIYVVALPRPGSTEARQQQRPALTLRARPLGLLLLLLQVLTLTMSPPMPTVKSGPQASPA
jgi:hypothetical protein